MEEQIDKTIKVKKSTLYKLEDIKRDREFSNMDEVINHLLKKDGK